MKKYKVIHLRDQCIGCNACVSAAPQNWIMDEADGRARLIGSKEKNKVFIGEILECDLHANKVAAESCPMGIIEVKEPKDSK